MGVLTHKLLNCTHFGGFIPSSDTLHTKYISMYIYLSPMESSSVKQLYIPSTFYGTYFYIVSPFGSPHILTHFSQGGSKLEIPFFVQGSEGVNGIISTNIRYFTNTTIINNITETGRHIIDV